jgi:hypothetical protein
MPVKKGTAAANIPGGRFVWRGALPKKSCFFYFLRRLISSK